MEESIERMRVLYEISVLMCDEDKSNLGERFQRALTMVSDAVESHASSLFILDEKTKKLEETATVGSRIDMIETVDFDMGKGLSAWVAKNRKSLLFPNLSKNRPDGFRCFISTPLLSKDTLVGVMNLAHSKPNAFTERHMEFLDIIAAQLAHAIERSRYERMLIEKNNALTKARHEIQEQQKKIVEMEKFQMLGQIAVSLNHEINNPLTTIMGNLELLLMMNPDMDEKISKRLETIQSESERIRSIVENLTKAKRVVIGDYLDSYGETMIGIDKSSEDVWEEKSS